MLYCWVYLGVTLPDDEPTIRYADAVALRVSEGADSNLTFVEAVNGLFLARNHGVTDDGKGLLLTVLGRVSDPENAPKGRKL